MQKMHRILAACAVLGVITAANPSKSVAQNTGNASQTIQAVAIVSEGLAINNLRNLDFGTVFPGLFSTVAETDATSGHFRVLGATSAEVQLSFPALPGTLDDGFGNSMSVTFTATESASDALGVGNACDTATGCTTNLDGTTGELHVYVGGTVTAGDPQPAGNYSATVTLNAAYTGN
jgi:hypothetical protein